MYDDGNFMEHDGNLMEHDGHLIKHYGNLMKYYGNFIKQIEKKLLDSTSLCGYHLFIFHVLCNCRPQATNFLPHYILSKVRLSTRITCWNYHMKKLIFFHPTWYDKMLTSVVNIFMLMSKLSWNCKLTSCHPAMKLILFFDSW